MLRVSPAAMLRHGAAAARAAGSAPRLGALAQASVHEAAPEPPLFGGLPGVGKDAATALASASPAGRHVDLKFQDGAAFRFHALWLRDACRDPAHVSAAAGERLLPATPVVAGCPEGLTAKEATLEGDGRVRIRWDDGLSGDSTFDGAFLRTYAGVVAEPIAGLAASGHAADVDADWLRPYSGYPGVLAPKPEAVRLWANKGDSMEFRRFSFPDLADTEVNLELLQAVVKDGLVVVDDMPDVEDASALNAFTDDYVGSLQKDPAREEANWKIAKKENAQSISYNADMRLNNHTDQSIPSHGAVGLLLAIHYVEGHGHNTVVDGIAAGEALRHQDPEAFRLLTTYHVDAERDYIASRVDASQNHTNSLLISTKYPLLQADAEGGLWRVQYNEVFRTPSMLPYDVFPRWYAAYRKYVDMLHSQEFERTIEMKKGQLMLLQNWRVLHGRAGYQSPTRTLVGGTITRENFYSKACQLLCRKHGVEPYRVHTQHA